MISWSPNFKVREVERSSIHSFLCYWWICFLWVIRIYVVQVMTKTPDVSRPYHVNPLLWDGAGSWNLSSWWKTLICLSYIINTQILHNQYHGCSWPGDTRSQGISSNDINLHLLEYFRASVRTGSEMFVTVTQNLWPHKSCSTFRKRMVSQMQFLTSQNRTSRASPVMKFDYM